MRCVSLKITFIYAVFGFMDFISIAIERSYVNCFV